MINAVVLGAARTAVATSRKGSLADTTAEELAVPVVKALLERTGVAPELVDDLIFAESLYGGGDIARYVALATGLTGAAGIAVNRHCAGSLAAVSMAAATVHSGMDRLVIAGGTQSFSTMPVMQRRIPGTVDDMEQNWMPMADPPREGFNQRDMTLVVGWTSALGAGLTREAQDAWALRSHQRAVAAIDSGQFEAEIVPIQARQKDGTFRDFRVDEHPRRELTAERMASLKPLHPEIEDFAITAGNSSGVNDAAAALVVANGDFAKAQGYEPIARIRGWAQIGNDPNECGLAPILCIPKLLDRTGVRQEDIALWEINEAFASVPLATCNVLGIDQDKVNISGSGCSLGHPVSASGARMLTTLIHDLKRRGGGLGVATMCAAAGQAGAVLVEV